MRTRRLHKALAIAGAVLVTAGCAGAVRHGDILLMALNGEAESYARQVLETQNRILMTIARKSLDPALSPPEQDRFYRLEDSLATACAPLQQIAYRRMNGETPGMALRLAAAGALDDCALRSKAAAAELAALPRVPARQLSAL